MNLNGNERRVFEAIQQAGEQLPSVVAQNLGLSRPTVSRMCRSLEKRGLLDQLQDPEDYRRTWYALTDLGKKAAKEMETQTN